MVKWIIVYLAAQVGLLVIILIVAHFKDKRAYHHHGETVPPGFVETEEIFYDPTENAKRRVYYNPHTGARFYKKESDADTKSLKKK